MPLEETVRDPHKFASSTDDKQEFGGYGEASGADWFSLLVLEEWRGGEGRAHRNWCERQPLRCIT
jgi:hypothetical protein